MLTAASQELRIFIVINLFIYILNHSIHKVIKIVKHIQKFQSYFRFGCHFVVLYRALELLLNAK